MSGKTALVTGGRIKIGFRSALWLLRCGCTVLVTSRFPRTAAAAYRALSDFRKWQDRLHIFGLDFRDVVAVEAFCAYLLDDSRHQPPPTRARTPNLEP